MKTYKVNCTCKHDFQDKEYGKQIRIATPTQAKPSTTERRVRCTVCTKEYTVKD